jgi:hypothetical protein
MIRKTKKTRKYEAPSGKVTQMALESNFCTTFNLQVDMLRSINKEVEGVEDGEPTYFEF